jgi:hypothetical protein
VSVDNPRGCLTAAARFFPLFAFASMQLTPDYYAGLGYKVFPCVPGGKRPATAHGLLDASDDQEQLRRWQEEMPTANWAILTDGLLVVDVDPLVDKGANGWPNDVDKARSLAAAPCAITPRGGRHFYFRQPPGQPYRNTTGALAPNVDTRADGGYVLCPPSTVNGAAYKWLNEDIGVAPGQLPLPPDWLIAALGASNRERPGERRAANVAVDSNRIPDGQRNATLTSLAGSMRLRGMSADEILAALRVTNAQRCVPPMDDREVETIARSIASYPPDQTATPVAEHHGEQDAKEAPVDKPADPGAMPRELLYVPGFVSRVMDLSDRGAHRPQPILALAGALSLLATLTGRKITDEQGTRTNLMAIGVCPTSMGKDRPRVVNKDLLYMAGLERMLGPESFKSDSGIISAIQASPAVLFQIDEMGRHMAANAASRNSHESNILTELMRLFTSSATVFRGGAYADPKKNVTILCPHAVVFGTTTPDAILSALTTDNLLDGFLSRTLLFEGDANAVKRSPRVPPLPKELVDEVLWWGKFDPGGGDIGQRPLVVETTADARRIMVDFETFAEQERRRLGDPLGSLWPRAMEKANKLALLYACSENHLKPMIGEAASRWATAMLDYLTRRLSYLASRWLAENRQESMAKRLLRIIEARGASGIGRSDITRLTQFLSIRDRNEVLETLVESGEVAVRTVPTGTKPKTIYVAMQFAAEILQ